MAYGAYGLVKRKINPFTHDILLDKIKKLDIAGSPHIIICIKDTFNIHPNRYLLYWDKRWSCWLFPNHKTPKYNVEGIIKTYAEGILDVPVEDVVYKGEKLHQKYSESKKIDRWYRHSFYELNLKEWNKHLEKDTFETNGIQYKWMSIAEMKDDPDIMKKNSDIVNYVEQLIG